ncbi:conserved hypothetical protein, partial [Ricinus communis]
TGEICELSHRSRFVYKGRKLPTGSGRYRELSKRGCTHPINQACAFGLVFVHRRWCGRATNRYLGPVALIATARGALYGSCNPSSATTMNISANNAGSAGILANTTDAVGILTMFANIVFSPLTPAYAGHLANIVSDTGCTRPLL